MCLVWPTPSVLPGCCGRVCLKCQSRRGSDGGRSIKDFCLGRKPRGKQSRELPFSLQLRTDNASSWAGVKPGQEGNRCFPAPPTCHRPTAARYRVRVDRFGPSAPGSLQKPECGWIQAPPAPVGDLPSQGWQVGSDFLSLKAGHACSTCTCRFAIGETGQLNIPGGSLQGIPNWFCNILACPVPPFQGPVDHVRTSSHRFVDIAGQRTRHVPVAHHDQPNARAPRRTPVFGVQSRWIWLPKNATCLASLGQAWGGHKQIFLRGLARTRPSSRWREDEGMQAQQATGQLSAVLDAIRRSNGREEADNSSPADCLSWPRVTRLGLTRVADMQCNTASQQHCTSSSTLLQFGSGRRDQVLQQPRYKLGADSRSCVVPRERYSVLQVRVGGLVPS
jgi:hypothetical protein